MPTSLRFPVHKTKIICTIGPASSSLDQIVKLVHAGMNVARLNLSHGDFKDHIESIHHIRAASLKAGREVSIFIDLPGVKMRIGRVENGEVLLKNDTKVILTTRPVLGNQRIIPVEYKDLPRHVEKGRIIYLNDGFIQLKVESVTGHEVHTKVLVGGRLSTHKGINLPGLKLDSNPITRRDLEIVAFGLKHGVSIFGLSFIQKPEDILRVRKFARLKGSNVHLIAKIERQTAVENFDSILKAADAVMIARGDLGIEVSIEEVPGIQKRLIQRANLAGRPVITATQMLESMTQNVRPTRAEVNDVANAILDGTDAIMLSQETAIGQYPVETVKMMAKIAISTERQRDEGLSDHKGVQISNKVAQSGFLSITDVTSLNAVRAAEELNARYILSPTSSGATARRISRFKPACWILSLSVQSAVCDFVNFSYGVQPLLLRRKITDDPHAILKYLKTNNLVKKGDTLIVTERRFSPYPGDTDSLGIVTL